MAQDAHDEWVLDVFGIDMEEAAGWGGKLTPIWTNAKEKLDPAFDKLQRALRETGDPDFLQIADYGLNGVTDRESVKLMAALIDADGGHGTDKLAAAVDRFRTFLDGSPIVDLIEDNPMGVAIPVRQQLGSALDLIAARIAA